jgi:hypothetical protein
MPTPIIMLNQDQIAFYHREGYLSTAALMTPEEVEQVRKIYDQLFAKRAGREEGNQFDLAGNGAERQRKLQTL